MTTATILTTATQGGTFTRAPEYVVSVVGHKPTATVIAECVVCGWRGYETCHGDTVCAHLAHVTGLHHCPEPGIVITAGSQS